MSRAALAVAAALVTLAAPARAQVVDKRHAHPGGLAAPSDRPVGMAELGIGWLTLPSAQLCTQQSQQDCKTGDSSPDLEAWQLYRANLAFAFGAGITLGLIPTTIEPPKDAQPVPAGEQPIVRDHSRSYFTVEGIGRYYLFVGDSIEAWAGITGGLVVVSDSFSSQRPFSDKAFVGPRAQTIRTEGYTIGLAVGGAYSLAPNWSLGASLRYGEWFLPKSPATNVLGDQASLTGTNAMFSLGVNVAYRIPL